MEHGRFPGRRFLAGAAALRGRSGRVRSARLSATAPRLRWLNEASSSIGTTLDLRRTAQEFADFSVPRLADACAVDLLESVLRGEEGERWTGPGVPDFWAVATSAVDRLGGLEPDAVEGKPHSGTTLVLRTVLTGKAGLVGRIRPEDYGLITSTASNAEHMRRAGVHSYMVVPLLARGVLLGVADFIRARGRPGFTSTDLALALQLASQAAVFVDNARLYGREREHVVELQRALLPRSVPRTVRLAVSSSYTPAAAAGGIGGDWFDVMPLPGGRTALVVGDVMAHGLPAAATMGRLRSVARTLLLLDISPELMLARLDLAARDLEEDQVATCLCVIHDPADRSYTIARAGHPPPLMVSADGEAAYVDVPTGAPVGTGVIPYDAVRVPAGPGSRLVLFTDGLVKTRSTDFSAELERLLDVAAVMEPGALEATSLTEASAPPGLPRFDEAAVVVAESLADDGWDVVQWELPRSATAAAAARRLAREQLSHWHLKDLADVTELVVSELVGNALRYGGGPGHLRMVRRDRLVVEVTDGGPDLPQIQHTDLSDEGGRGLQLINTLCRRWGTCRIPGGKTVWAEQDIPGLTQREPIPPVLNEPGLMRGI
ncbi:serine phosphatase with GAF(s) sensor(s) [Streptomyces albus]|uniref:Serine phosphatase with GAF(S) sensor(S) n=1 Tax=Streptomyces albus (strain ATCC 21838 / DSM 41398 / FERM P-419 / JCM 4703 / NBRC 107858) TaxID=1081613 RepID=A0A0B5EGE3_STRA4|nr:serine phosphatase with GAF(s) sensor(s) [Streptomyces albus]AOU74704.1 protein serine phosphatase with GAF(s) sensor(s) [Streptomyces albus]AYN30515.1 serine phosphatase with GAF(s) sensor(s) [Streptomyces albus]